MSCKGQDTESGRLWRSDDGGVGGIVTRYDLRTNVARSVEVWPQVTTGWDLTYRFVWTVPLTISPHDHYKVCEPPLRRLDPLLAQDYPCRARNYLEQTDGDDRLIGIRQPHGH